MNMKTQYLLQAMAAAGMYINYERRVMTFYAKTTGRKVTGI